MGVTSDTGTVTPSGSEQTVAAIAGGPFDLVSVYFKGGLGGQPGAPLQLALYALVDGQWTRIAQKQVMGSSSGSLVVWEATGGAPASYLINAGGTQFEVTVQDTSGVTAAAMAPARQPVTMTVAGVNIFDTASDEENAAKPALDPGQSASLPTFDGYAERMDVACDQRNLPATVVVSVFASCGGGSVLALVKSVALQGRDDNVTAVFRDLELPVATEYVVQISNQSLQAIAVEITGATYSVQAAGGGVMLSGNTNGPSNNNTNEDFVNSVPDADVTVATLPKPTGSIYVGLNGLTADRTVFLNNTATGKVGDTTTIKDEDGSLADFTITVDPGAGNTIDGESTYTMTAVQNGLKGSITVKKISATAFAIV